MTNVVSAKEQNKTKTGLAVGLGWAREFGTKKETGTKRPPCSWDSAWHLLAVEGWGREEPPRGGVPVPGGHGSCSHCREMRI